MLGKTVGDPVAATKPHQGSSNAPSDDIGNSGKERYKYNMGCLLS